MAACTTIEVENRGDVKIVTITAEKILDNHQLWRLAVELHVRLMEQWKPKLVIHLGRVAFISYRALGVLLKKMSRLNKACKATRGQLIVCGASAWLTKFVHAADCATSDTVEESVARLS